MENSRAIEQMIGSQMCDGAEQRLHDELARRYGRRRRTTRIMVAIAVMLVTALYAAVLFHPADEAAPTVVCRAGVNQEQMLLCAAIPIGMGEDVIGGGIRLKNNRL